MDECGYLQERMELHRNNLQIYRTTMSVKTFQRAEYMRNILKTLFERHRLSCVVLVISLKTYFFGDNWKYNGAINLLPAGLKFPLKFTSNIDQNISG
jgi:hypothetical protein